MIQTRSGTGQRAARLCAPKLARALALAATLGLALAAPTAAAAGASPELHTAASAGADPELRATAGAGPELRAAVAALEAGAHAEADALLAAVSARHPVIADHADLLRMRLAVEEKRSEDALAFEPLWTGRDSPLLGRFYTLLGRALREAGREARARAAWEAAAVATPGRAERAALDLEIAESHLREGRNAPAIDRLLEIWTAAADRPVARDAERLLARLERGGPALRHAPHYLKRADTLFRRYHNEDALEAYDRALALGVSGRERSHALAQRAETLFRLRRYNDAIEAYDALPPDDERAIQRARAEARAGRVRAGAQALERMGRRGGGQAVRALYLAGLLWDGEDDARAGALFAEVVHRAPGSNAAADSRWWLGWHAYREGRLEEAERLFGDLAHRERDAVTALRPRYWQARARERLGLGDAQQRYAEIAHEFPFSYYGWRALERLAAPLAPRRPPTLVPGRRALEDAQLARPRILLEAGLEDEARDELARLFERARGLEDRLALAELYAETGAYDRAQSLVVSAYSETLARGPAPGHLELWWHAWPAPYEGELADAARPGGPGPELVYSIMREESGYRPEVISISGARGLLQLMPTTAARVAASLGEPHFDPDTLFRPAVNIRLGSAYLGQLLERFDGYAPAAIGSYNAGPEAVARWLREPRPDDEWVEQISYGQTRAYVKRVLRSLHVYRVLY